MAIFHPRRRRPSAYERELRRLVHSGMYTERELDSILRMKWHTLTDEGKWVQTLMVQAGFELIHQSEQEYRS